MRNPILRRGPVPRLRATATSWSALHIYFIPLMPNSLARGGACVCSVADDGFGRDAGSAVGSVEGMRCTIPAASVLLWPRQSVGRSAPAMKEGDFLSNVTRLDRPWPI